MFEFDAALSTAIDVSEKPQSPPDAGAKVEGPLSASLVDKIHRYWYAANYLCVGQIYLLDNPLLREPLKKEHIKPRLLGHWGTSAGQNFIYVHLNRLIRQDRGQRHLHIGARAWRPDAQRLRLSGRHVHRRAS